MGAGHLFFVLNRMVQRTGGMKGKIQLILFVFESDKNRAKWDFPFIPSLILNYTRLSNQARQAEITQQISEIVGGADALSTVSED